MSPSYFQGNFETFLRFLAGVPLLIYAAQCTICSAMINNERAMKKVNFAQFCINAFRLSLTLPQHLYVEHRASWRWVKRLYGEPARPANNRQHNRQPDIPDYPSTGDYDVRLSLTCRSAN